MLWLGRRDDRRKGLSYNRGPVALVVYPRCRRLSHGRRMTRLDWNILNLDLIIGRWCSNRIGTIRELGM